MPPSLATSFFVLSEWLVRSYVLLYQRLYRHDLFLQLNTDRMYFSNFSRVSFGTAREDVKTTNTVSLLDQIHVLELFFSHSCLASYLPSTSCRQVYSSSPSSFVPTFAPTHSNSNGLRQHDHLPRLVPSFPSGYVPTSFASLCFTTLNSPRRIQPVRYIHLVSAIAPAIPGQLFA
ncbi:unnamed protein product [Protopolystoma xenopodis]|uniref:Uncharacterized protein n=1 Tax=Protopolystoma xenopodis TaxID=117903 RepID=A0A3S5CSD7_9PLAT|nr:unnamed protein product [Protopolystoma xenopodis]